MKGMEADYKVMSEIFAGEVPNCDEIIKLIEKFEKNFNGNK